MGRWHVQPSAAHLLGRRVLRPCSAAPAEGTLAPGGRRRLVELLGRCEELVPQRVFTAFPNASPPLNQMLNEGHARRSNYLRMRIVTSQRRNNLEVISCASSTPDHDACTRVQSGGGARAGARRDSGERSLV